MQVIYLDQNAASFLAKSNSEKIWQEIKEVLLDGFRNRKLICPLPFECVVESASCPLELRQSIQALFWQLQKEIATVTESLKQLRESPDYELCQLAEQKPGILDELAEERSKQLEIENAELEKQTDQLAKEIKKLSGK
jgi:hypothetical protein